ncbi:hypothetical protein [Arthrobacter oryzae]|uniref:hypothetical protein n=1 Tax=Arthrobacter oryzae TaxID=409290 RepID=UPI0028619BFE|nr:hypothetical protein [Arthrobacter oryzae]MDR6508074.1 hypothetical protein [Arthrobacter oryzae]
MPDVRPLKLSGSAAVRAIARFSPHRSPVTGCAQSRFELLIHRRQIMARRHASAASIFALTTVLAFAGLSVPAQAVPAPVADPPLIAFQLTTTVDTTVVGGSPDTPVSIIYRFSPTLAPVAESEVHASYVPLERLIIEVGDQCTATSGSGTGIDVFNNSSNTLLEDSYNVFAYGDSIAGKQLFGRDVESFRFLLVDNDGTMFSDASLPTSVAFADAADYIQFNLVLSGRVFLFPPESVPFQLSPYNVQAPVDALRDYLSGLTLSPGVRTPLANTLDKASGYLNTLTPASLQKATKEFDLFIKQVEAQRNKGIDSATADTLISLTRDAVESLPGCA